MPSMLQTDHQRWSFSEEEELIARIFPDLQLAHLQNELAIALEIRAKEAVNPVNIQEYLMTVEYQRGVIETLQNLILMHENAKNRLLEKAQNEANIANFESKYKPFNPDLDQTN